MMTSTAQEHLPTQQRYGHPSGSQASYFSGSTGWQLAPSSLLCLGPAELV